MPTARVPRPGLRPGRGTPWRALVALTAVAAIAGCTAPGEDGAAKVETGFTTHVDHAVAPAAPAPEPAGTGTSAAPPHEPSSGCLLLCPHGPAKAPKAPKHHRHHDDGDDED